MVSDHDVPVDLVEELIGVPEASLPTSDLMATLSSKATELMMIEVRLKQIEEEERDLLDRRQALAARELPDLMDQAQIDRVGIPGMLSDVVMEPWYHANIKADWDYDKREAGFRALEDLGGGDLIRTTVSVSFQKGEHDLANDLVRHIERWNGLQGRPVKRDMNVPWASLTSFVKDMVVSGRPGIFGYLDTLGATVSRRCRVIARKVSSPKFRR